MILRKHRCIKCGYLCFELNERRFLGEERYTGPVRVELPHFENITKYQEYTIKERRENIELQRGQKTLFCFRREPTFELELENIFKTHRSSGSNMRTELDALVNNSRKCRYYTNYIPGYSPMQHLTKMEAIERERSNRYWSFLYLLIGAILTAIGALIIKLLFQ